MNDALFVILMMAALVGWSVYKSRSRRQSKRRGTGTGAAGFGKAAEAYPGEDEAAFDTRPHTVRERPAERRRHPVHASSSDRRKESPNPASEKPEIRLRTPSDARRAFIYSEIFNRKY